VIIQHKQKSLFSNEVVTDDDLEDNRQQLELQTHEFESSAKENVQDIISPPLSPHKMRDKGNDEWGVPQVVATAKTPTAVPPTTPATPSISQFKWPKLFYHQKVLSFMSTGDLLKVTAPLAKMSEMEHTPQLGLLDFFCSSKTALASTSGVNLGLKIISITMGEMNVEKALRKSSTPLRFVGTPSHTSPTVMESKHVLVNESPEFSDRVALASPTLSNKDVR